MKHVAKGWLCPICTTIYSPAINTCYCTRKGKTDPHVTGEENIERELRYCAGIYAACSELYRPKSNAKINEQIEQMMDAAMSKIDTLKTQKKQLIETLKLKK